MLFSPSGSGAWAALFALCGASPTPVDMPLNQGANDLILREAMRETIRTPHLEERLSADFSLERSWKNDVLFAGYVS